MSLAEGGHSEGGKEISPEELTDLDEELKRVFVENFTICAQKALGNSADCRLVNMGTSRHPDANYGAKNSCHKNNPAQAIDVGKIICGGSSADPQQNPEEYMYFAKCMANETQNTMKVIYRDHEEGNMFAGGDLGTHEDHAHIQSFDCQPSGGGQQRTASSY